MALQFIQNSADTITVLAPAKVNLFLEILGKRPDGFHEINSLFQAVDLYDRLTFRLVDEQGLSIKSSRPVGFALDKTNLIARAYYLMADRFGLERGLEVLLEKNIPVAAGLGGGSADAAATIAAVNSLLNLRLSSAEMAEVGLEIGSDIPFFFGHGQALVGGRGELLKQSSFPTDYTLLIVTPKVAISTVSAYAGLRMDLTNHKVPFRLNRCSSVRGFVEQIRLSVNDFEKIHFLSYPVSDRIKHGLLERGASLVRLSGSGPTIFGLFTEATRFDENEFKGDDDWQVHKVRPVVVGTE